MALVYNGNQKETFQNFIVPEARNHPIMVFKDEHNLKETEILSLRTGKKLQEEALKKYFLFFPYCAEVLSQKVPDFFRIFLKSFLRVCHNPKVSECIESVLTNRFYGPFD